MKIIFFGSDGFAAKHMEALMASKHDVVGCVTQPDRPKGRGMKMVVSPIKELGVSVNMPVLQPTDLKDVIFLEELKALDADIFVVIAYGRFLPQELLDMPRHTPINVHGSILPKYRGAGPINWAIINGEKESGITVAKINAKMDSGDILATASVVIEDTDDASTLRQKMLRVGPKSLIEVLDAIESGKETVESQDESRVTLAPKLTKELGHIDWSKSAVEIFNLMRGLVPWPNAYTFYEGKFLKILSADVVEGDSSKQYGEVVDINEEGFSVQAAQGVLLIKEVHLESSKRMCAKDFLLGHQLFVGFKFTSNK